MNSLSPVRVFNERKDLRILFVFPWWGTETFAESEVKALRSLGAKVGVLVLRGVKGRSASSSEVNELPLFTLATFRNLISFLLSHPKIFASQLINLVKENLFNPRHLVRYLFVLIKAPSVAYLIKDRKFEIVHFFWGHYPVVVAPIIKAIAPNIKISAFLGAYTLVERLPSAKRLYQSVDAVTTHAPFQKQEIYDYLGDKSKSVLCILRGTPASTTQSVSRDYIKRELRVLIVSRLFKDKRVDLGLKAFRRIKDFLPYYSLEIIGEGPELSKLKEIAKELGLESSVVFRGRIPNEEVVERLGNSRLLLFPSQSAGDMFPNVMKEAFALKTPCVAFDIQGVRVFQELSFNSVLLCKSGDYKTLANNAVSILTSESERERLISGGLEAVKPFEINKTSNAQFGFFQMLIES